MVTKITVCFCLLLGLVWCVAQALPFKSAVEVTTANVGSFYSKFTRLTKKPWFVAPYTAKFCAIPSPEEKQAAERAKGPYLNSSVHFYANPAATEAIARKQAVFPEGSVFVKEKLAKDGSVNGIGGMIKRAPGFDTPNGNWEYFYSEKATGFTIGKIKSCAECHSGDHTKDGVFRAWQPFE